MLIEKKEDSNSSFTTVNKTTKKGYRISANESTHFSAYKRVKHKMVYRVEVMVITKRKKLLHDVQPQFKASTILLPIKVE